MFNFVQQYYIFETKFNRDNFNYMLSIAFENCPDAPIIPRDVDKNVQSRLTNTGEKLKEIITFRKGDARLTKHLTDKYFLTVIQPTFHENDVSSNSPLLKIKELIEKSDFNENIESIEFSSFGFKANPGSHFDDVTISMMWISTKIKKFVIFFSRNKTKLITNIFLNNIIVPLLNSGFFPPDLDLYELFSIINNIVTEYSKNNSAIDYSKAEISFKLFSDEEDKFEKIATVKQWSYPEIIGDLQNYLSLLKNKYKSETITSASIGFFLLRKNEEDKQIPEPLMFYAGDEEKGLRIFSDSDDVELPVDCIIPILRKLIIIENKNDS